MPADYYDSETSAPDQAAGEDSAAPPAEEKTSERKTALLNADICPGMEVGDEIVLKVVGKHDGEYEVAYSPGPEKKGQGEEAGEPGEAMGAGMGAHGGMGAMYE